MTILLFIIIAIILGNNDLIYKGVNKGAIY